MLLAKSKPQIIADKLRPRLSSPRPVSRARLLDRMRAAAGAALVLVHGPAGFGKTTAMLQYYAQAKDRGGIAVGWLTLDRADNDLVRFLFYLTQVIQEIDPGRSTFYLTQVIQEIDPGRSTVAGERGAPATHGGDDAAMELTGKLTCVASPFILFLDDFECIENPVVIGLVRQIVEQLPEKGQLVIGSRAVPDLGLGSLRAHGRLAEVDAAQLRFSLAETALFLRQQQGLALRNDDIQHLQQRTDGWPAALRLVSLSLRERSDPQAFVDTFNGSNAAIADYLMEDVLARQDAPTCHFLLQTSVLHDLSAALCDFVLERSDSSDMLTQVERAHLFLVAQDSDRRWYRYHALFSEFLRNQLQRRDPQAMARLYRRASQWWLDAGQPMRAIEYALHCGDVPFLLSMLHAHAADLLWRGRARTLARWYTALPPEVDLSSNPALMLNFAWALTLTHRYELSLALLDASTASQPPGAEDPLLEIETRIQRAFIFAMTDRIKESSTLWRTCVAQVSAAQPFGYAMLGASFGYCLVAENRFDEARLFLEQARRRVLEIGNSFIAPMALCLEGAIDLAQGRLRSAISSFRAALVGTTPAMFSPVAGNTVAAAFLAEALYETNHIDEAERLLGKHLPLLKEAAAPDQMITSFVVMARIAVARGNHARAIECLAEMEVVGHRKALPRMVASARLERGRIALLDGQLQTAQRQLASAAEGWVWQPFDGLVTHANDTEAPCIADLRWRIHAGRAQSAVAPLKHAIKLAQGQHRRRRALKLSILLAHAQCMTGQKLAGFRRLRDALQFAASEGFVRSFLDEGPALLRWVVEVVDAPAEAMAGEAAIVTFAQRLLAAGGLPRPALTRTTPPMQPALPGGGANLLSGREIQVLRLLAEGHRNKVIAEKLFVSETTVKAHLRSINVKLGTHSRTHATAVARQKGLIA